MNNPMNETKPEPPSWLFDNIAEASKNASGIYLLYIGFISYSVLTVVGTKDQQMILKNEAVHLPIINFDVSINGFFILAPLVAICIFIYLQLYLGRLKSLITNLHNNYAPQEEGRLYPWVINIAEESEPGIIGKLQRIIVKFSFWFSLPITLILFAMWVIKKHAPHLSYLVGVYPIVGTVIVLLFWCNYENVKIGGFLRSPWKLTLASLVLIFQIFLILFIIPWSKTGLPVFQHIKIARYFNWIYVDLRYQKLVTEPQQDYSGIYWADLEDVHLEGANLTSSVLKRADLTRAQMQRAMLNSSILDGANLESAKLQEANLVDANLQKAKLGYANLQGANLENANLQKAELGYANLQEANLEGANLQGANLEYANLQKAELGYANLQEAKLLSANLQEANLVDANLNGAELVKANLQGANLLNADLQEEDLGGINLQEAKLPRANLQGANLVDANLQEAFLGDANLQKAYLGGANLQKAYLGDANLQGANLESAKLQGANLLNANLQKASLWGANLQEAYLENAKLQGASLKDANLQKADLEDAKLQGANLLNANLQKASLWGANLQGAYLLTIEQLSEVETLYRAKLDSSLREQVQNKYPHLLEEPKTNK